MITIKLLAQLAFSTKIKREKTNIVQIEDEERLTVVFEMETIKVNQHSTTDVTTTGEISVETLAEIPKIIIIIIVMSMFILVQITNTISF